MRALSVYAYFNESANKRQSQTLSNVTENCAGGMSYLIFKQNACFFQAKCEFFFYITVPKILATSVLRAEPRTSHRNRALQCIVYIGNVLCVIVKVQTSAAKQACSVY